MNNMIHGESATPYNPCEAVAPLDPCNVPRRRCSVPEAPSRRILVMNFRAFGDLLMASPLLNALRSAMPDAHLSFLAERRYREGVDAHPCLDELLLWDPEEWAKILDTKIKRTWFLRVRKMKQALRGRRYDVFISLDPEKWSMTVRGIAAPLSIGVFDTFRQTDNAIATSRYARLFHVAYVHPNLPEHRTDQYLLPLHALDLPEPVEKAMCLGFTADDAAAAERFLESWSVSAHEPLVVVAPMTTWSSRCWPAEYYVKLSNALARYHGCRVILIGSQKERPDIEDIAARMETIPILAAGILSFRQMGALIARSRLLISGDTGPMHVAAAVGTPYVTLFGPTPVAARAPLMGRGRTLVHPVPCGPCDQAACSQVGEDYLRCLHSITVDHVLKAAEPLLQPSIPVQDEILPTKTSAGVRQAADAV